MRKTVSTSATMVALSIALTGCIATTQPSGTLSPTEVALRQKQNENVRVVQGVATGAAIGAIVGGGLSFILSGGDEDALVRGAAVGALAGGVMGGADAKRVNKEAGAEAAKQDELKAIIEATNKAIDHYRGMASLAAKLAAEKRAEIESLNTSYNTGQLDRDAYRSQVSDARANMRIIDGEISDVERDIRDVEAAAGRGLDLNAYVAKLKSQKAMLEKERTALADAYSRVPQDIGLSIPAR